MCINAINPLISQKYEAAPWYAVKEENQTRSILRGVQKHTSLGSNRHICVNTRKIAVAWSLTRTPEPLDANKTHQTYSACMTCTHVFVFKGAIHVLKHVFGSLLCDSWMFGVNLMSD